MWKIKINPHNNIQFHIVNVSCCMEDRSTESDKKKFHNAIFSILVQYIYIYIYIYQRSAEKESNRQKGSKNEIWMQYVVCSIENKDESSK